MAGIRARAGPHRKGKELDAISKKPDFTGEFLRSSLGTPTIWTERTNASGFADTLLWYAAELVCTIAS